MTYPLIPFAAPSGEAEALAENRVSGSVDRRGNSLAVGFHLRDTASLDIPPPAVVPERRHELWRATCFEVFLARPGESGYREVNLSPAGHWNIYRFIGYRQGMEEERAVAALPFQVVARAGVLTLDVVIDLTALGLKEAAIEVGLSAVLLERTGRVTYHALAHPGAAEGQPDFHRREGFRLHLPP